MNEKLRQIEELFEKMDIFAEDSICSETKCEDCPLCLKDDYGDYCLISIFYENMKKLKRQKVE